MKDKRKKWLVATGLVAVCTGLVFGIWRGLYREPEPVLRPEPKAMKDVETVVDVNEGETELPVAEEAVNPQEFTAESDETMQAIQPTPEKTEEEKPEEPPAEDEKPKTPPTQTDPEKEGGTKPDNTTPSHGDTKDGMIYIDGFGWIPNEGGGGSGTAADDMYENGNKIGIMD